MNETIGLLAGSGELPENIIKACKAKSINLFVVGFKDITPAEILSEVNHAVLGIGKVGAILKKFSENNVSKIVMAGKVGRPSLSSLSIDVTGLRLLTNIFKLGSRGDDKLFSTIIKFIESKNFQVIGADDILPELLIEDKILTESAPSKKETIDIQTAKRAALAIGELDIGQAVIIQSGVILGVEGIEGTDNLMKRCFDLKDGKEGSILVKMKKPHQDKRVDMPTIGVNTIENAHKLGIRGIAIEAGGCLVLNKEKVIELANKYKIFITGVKP